MQKITRNKSIGLDIGQSSGKVVCVVRKGHQALLQRADVFHLRDEGILGDDETEQFQAISSWLKELKLLKSRVVLGLPQYMATTKVSDFAKGAKGRQLDQMVNYETTQLSGISDDQFIHDYAVMPAGNGRQNPALIGLCREANVDDFARRATEVSIQLEDVAMTGLAMVNAFVQLQPQDWRATRLQMLMDVGTESSTVVLMHSGQVLYIGGMMFGGSNVTQELSRQLQVDALEAEHRKLKGEVDWASLSMAALDETEEHLSDGEDEGRFVIGDEALPRQEAGMHSSGLKLPASLLTKSRPSSDVFLPGLDCFRLMVRELENCLEHWRSSELEEVGSQELSKIWLCGGGSRLEQVTTYLEVSQGCAVEIFGPRLDKEEPVNPDLTIAYGLGVQGLGLAEYSLSMTPSELTWVRGKEYRSRYLVAALLLVFCAVAGGMFYRYYTLGQSILSMEEETDDLKDNVKRLSRLDEMKREYLETLIQAMPIVENKVQAARFLRMLSLLEDAVKHPGIPDCRNWCVYVADEESFQENNPLQESKAGTASELKVGRRNSRRQLLETEDKPVADDHGWSETLAAEKEVHDAVSLRTSRVFYVVGVIMSKYDNHNKIEELIMSKLKQGHVRDSADSPLMFKDVQLMSESERSRCKARAVYDWENCLVNMRTSQAFKSYDHRSFFLRLTLLDPGVELPEKNPLEPVRRKGRRRRR